MSYKTSKIWNIVASQKSNEVENSASTKLVNAFEPAWENAIRIASRISTQLPGLTLHDKDHFNALFRCADLLVGEEHKLNPLEVFTFGMAVLIHDIGHTTAVYKGGRAGVEETVEYRDALSRFDDQNSKEAKDYALFTALRKLHARQAEEILTTDLPFGTGAPIYLLPDETLRDCLGHAIGQIAASHHWDRTKIADSFETQIPPPTGYPNDWEIRSDYIAILLRCSDAIQIDRARATPSARGLHQPSGVSALHWEAQGKIASAQLFEKREKTLVFSSTNPFSESEIKSWWVAYDLCNVAHDELAGCSKLLRDLNLPSFTADCVLGAHDPETLCEHIKVKDWQPVNAEIKITDTKRIINLFGGEKLYGRDPIVPIREAIQNAADAIRAKQEYSGTTTHRDKIELSVTLDDKSAKISISDTGIGMSKSVLTGALIEFGKSLWKSNDIQDEHPGFLSKQVQQSGQYGIGFFSYFMISSWVKVISSNHKNKETHSLEVTEGELRPVLREVEHNDLKGFSTIVEFEYSRKDYDKLLSVQLYGRFSDPKQITLCQLIGSLCATLPFDIYVNEGGVEKLAHRHDWHEQNNADWLNQLMIKIGNFSDQTRLQLKKNASLLTNFVSTDNPPLVIGKAAISLFGTLPGKSSIGGFCAPPSVQDSHQFIGALPMKPSGPKRDSGDFMDVSPNLSEWATKQADEIKKFKLPPDERLHASENICHFDGDPIEIAVCALNDEIIDISTIVSIVRDGKLIHLPAFYSKDETKFFATEIELNPTYHNSITIDVSEIDFDTDVIHCETRFHSINYYYINIEEGIIKPAATSLLGCILRKLDEAGLKYTLDFEEKCELGKYTGPSGLRKGLKTGDPILMDCVVIRPSPNA